MDDNKLSAREARFSDEYLIDLNGKQAAIRAGYSPKTAEQQASRLLSKVKVQEYIAERMKEREQRTEITQDMVLRRWWEISNADPRDLIEYHRCACRHCHGQEHQYQWIDEAEYIKACENASDDEAKIPSCEGGYGFNPTKLPHENCPKCFGRGHGEVIARDTRTLPKSAALLYAGVKVTKEGFEMKMQDQGKALENVARHLGMFVDKSEVKHGGQIETKHSIDPESLTEEQLRVIAGIKINAG